MKVRTAKAILAQRESLARIGQYGDRELLEAARTLANEVNRLRGEVMVSGKPREGGEAENAPVEKAVQKPEA